MIMRSANKLAGIALAGLALSVMTLGATPSA